MLVEVLVCKPVLTGPFSHTMSFPFLKSNNTVMTSLLHSASTTCFSVLECDSHVLIGSFVDL